MIREIRWPDSIRGSLLSLNEVQSHWHRLTTDHAFAANTLNLACLPLSTRQSQLRELLAPYGVIISVKMTRERSSLGDFSRPSASATVIFDKPQQAEKAQSAIDGGYMGEGWRLKASWGDREQPKGEATLILSDR